MRSILGLFAKSPFGPTQAHMKKAIECAQQLHPLFEAAFADDYAEVERLDLIHIQDHIADSVQEVQFVTTLLRQAERPASRTSRC